MLEQKDLEKITSVVENAVNKAVKPIKSDMRALQLTLENETNRGIQIIAEGHLDLTGKLDEALKIENEKEMMKLRINRLESELKKVKEKLEETA